MAPPQRTFTRRADAQTAGAVAKGHARKLLFETLRADDIEPKKSNTPLARPYETQAVASLLGRRWAHSLSLGQPHRGKTSSDCSLTFYPSWRFKQNLAPAP